MPVVSTLHTILRDPTREQKLVLQEVINLSARVVSMAEKGVGFLCDIYGTPADKIDLIPHGIPDVPFAGSTGTAPVTLSIFCPARSVPVTSTC
jgi:hypothetical protein